MLIRLKNHIVSILDRRIQSIVEKQIDQKIPIIFQLIDYENSGPEDRLSYYEQTKNSNGSREYYETVKSSLVKLELPVEEITINIEDFMQWKNKNLKFTRFYESYGDVYIEKCLEHYLSNKFLRLYESDVYVDIAASSSPWAGYLRTHYNISAYRLDLSYPKGIHKYDIGADAGKTDLPDHFANVLSAQCAFECFMGDADIRFVQESERILKIGGRFGIVPLYIEDTFIISSSPYCVQDQIIIDAGAKKVWRDDRWRVPFARHYSPQAFKERIWNNIPMNMKGNILFFKNIDEISSHFPDQRIYCYFMLYCEKKR